MANAPLTIRFATDISSAKNGLQDLAASVISTAFKIKGGMQDAADAYNTFQRVASTISGVSGSLSTLAVNAAIGAGAILAVEGAFKLVGAAADAGMQSVQEMVKVLNQAQAAGVGTTFFQGFIGQARDLGTQSSTLAQMLTHARDASQNNLGTVDAKGNVSGRDSAMQTELAAQAQVGNISQAAVTAFNSATSQEDRIRSILDLVDQLRQKGMDLAAFSIGEKMFGPDFEQQLRNGSDIIEKMRAALDGMSTSDGNRVFTPEELARAKEVNDKVNEAKDTLANAYVPLQRQITEIAQENALAVADIEVQWAKVVARMAEVLPLARSVVASMAGALESFGRYVYGSDVVDKINAAGLNGVKPTQGAPVPTDSGPMRITVRGSDKSKPTLAPSSGGGGGGSTDTDAVQSYIDQLSKSTAALKAESDAQGKSNAEKTAAINLAKAEEIAKANDQTLSADQISKIRSLSIETQNLKDHMADVKQHAQEMAEAYKDFGNLGTQALTDLILNGKSLNDVMSNLAKTLASQALQALIMGSGPLAGFLGTAPAASQGSNAIGGLFGTALKALGVSGGRASGGPVYRGQTYTVGEVGRETITMGADGWVTPAGSSNGGGSSGGGGVTVIDQRTTAAAPAEVTKTAGGDTRIVLREAQKGMANDIYRGRGPMKDMVDTSASRRG